MKNRKWPACPRASPMRSWASTSPSPIPNETNTPTRKKPTVSPTIAPTRRKTESPVETEAVNTETSKVRSSAPSNAPSIQTRVETPIDEDLRSESLLGGDSVNNTSSSETEATNEAAPMKSNLAISLISIGAVISMGAVVLLLSNSSCSSQQTMTRSVRTVTEKSITSKKSRGKNADEENCTQSRTETVVKNDLPAERKQNSYEMQIDAIVSDDLSTLYDTPSQKADEHYFRKAVNDNGASDCGLTSVWERFFETPAVNDDESRS